MVVIFIKKDSIPDTLVQCVFGACGLEGGVMGWIKTTKERRQDRRWAWQDARETERAAREERENNQC
jgi:coenzyme F420-reducing hydrogenase gamma subunit